jgi:ribonucleoside-diphosphate reductase alpha chain
MKLIPVKLGQNGLQVLKKRYLTKNENGEPNESASELFLRVAEAVADAEKNYGAAEEKVAELRKAFYEMMAEGRFMPNSPTLMNAGRRLGMLSACFVLPVGDSIDEIFSSIKDMALIQKSGGGTGFDFSRLRPKGDLVASSGGRTSGPLSFLKVFSDASHAIQQGAFRRGANMGVMRIDHPDILDFIKAKEDLNFLTNFNLSVAITDLFMQNLQKEPELIHQVINPRTSQQYDLKDENGEPVTCRRLFDLIVKRAWQTGEPGILFIDRINENNPIAEIGAIEATNPCGEQPLLAYESCNLGSINLLSFIQNDKFCHEEFCRTVELATRFLDNIIDINKYPIPQIETQTKNNRKIGLGLMGFADALYALGIPYDSEDGLKFGAEIMELLQTEGHQASARLAEEKEPFPNYRHSRYAKEGLPRRNACVSTIAPTGSISIICGCSGGIEPLFSLAFQRNILNGEKLFEINPVFEQKARENDLFCDELVEKIAAAGSIQEMTEIPAEFRRIFVTARDISPEWHIKMQAAFQKHCDASISKTINFPAESEPAAVENAFHQAFTAGLKGITVYRDGCRENQPMSRTTAKAEIISPVVSPQKQNTPGADLPFVEPVPLPEILTAMRIRQMTPFGNIRPQFPATL